MSPYMQTKRLVQNVQPQVLSPILQFLYIYERVKNQDDPSVNFSYNAQQKILELDQLPVFGAISTELELSQAWALYQKITYYNNFHFNSFLKSLKKHNFGSHQPCTRQTKYILKKQVRLVFLGLWFYLTKTQDKYLS